MARTGKMRGTVALTALAAAAGLSAPAGAEVVVRGKEGRPLSEIRQAPGAIYPDLRTIVAQPSPSEVKPEFLGPVLMMKSAHVDLEKGTATLPLRRGKLKNGTPVWFIITDTTDENLSNLHGVNYAPKLAYGLTGSAARKAFIEKDGTFTFAAGSVDFKPALSVVPGPAEAPFPPKSFAAGSVGDAAYTPLVLVENAAKSVILNAPVVSQASEAELNAMCDGAVDYTKVHDKVVAICPRDETVTLKLTLGFTFDKPIQYLSTEANDPLVAALETATYTPAMKDLPFALEDASPGESAERIVVVVNGPVGLDNPHRQGLVSALTDGRGPLNVLGGIPTINLDYSPMWRLFPAVWTDEAIEKGYRYRMTSALQAAEMATRGFIKSLDGKDFRAVGFVVNCPIVYRIN